MMRMATSSKFFPQSTLALAKICMPLALTIAALSIIFRAWNGDAKAMPTLVVTTVVFATIVKVILMFAVLAFMLVAPAGTYLRQYVIAKMMGGLIRPVYNEYPHVPIIPLTGIFRGQSVGVRNIKSWMLCRAVFGTHFGMGTKFRSDFCLALIGTGESASSNTSLLVPLPPVHPLQPASQSAHQPITLPQHRTISGQWVQVGAARNHPHSRLQRPHKAS